jgi:hypothetical protein
LGEVCWGGFVGGGGCDDDGVLRGKV